MKLIFSIVLLIPIVTTYSQSQNDWYWNNPVPVGSTITSLTFVTKSTAYATSYNGTIIRSTDSGLTWKSSKQLTSKPLRSIAFGNETFGVAVGDQSIFTTTDAGESWNDTYPEPEFPNDGPYDCLEVQLSHNNIGWITASGKFFRSTDTGQSWKKIAINSGGILTSHYFLNDTLGFCTNSIGGVLKSTNGGQTWNAIASTGLFWTKKIRFSSPSDGWMTGSTLYTGEGFIAKTTDGGTNWIFLDSTGSGFNDVEIIDSLHVVAVGNNGWIKYTTDGGSSWFNSFPNTSDNCLDITKNGNTLWLGGGGDRHPMLAMNTTDLNKNWKQQKTYFSLADFNGICFESDSIGWLAGESGALFKTNDRGFQWNPIPFFTINFLSMYSPEPNRLFLGGDDGELVSTFDGGNSWNIVSFGRYYDILQITFSSHQNGWFVLSSHFQGAGSLYSTTNGGKDWTKANNPSRVQKIQFLDSLHGWYSIPPPIISLSSESEHSPQETGLLYRTTDGGESWISVTTPGYIRNFFFLSSSEGWSSVYTIQNPGDPFPTFFPNDTLYRTIDGGLTWSPYSVIPGLNSVTEMLFTTVKEGWLRLSSDLYKSVDSGRSFVKQLSMNEYNGRQYLSKLFFQSPDFGWYVGSSGAVMNYSHRLTNVRTHDDPIFPVSLNLYQNYPNPFNPVTTLEFDLPIDSHSSLKIFNIVGQQVDELFNDFKKKGRYKFFWNGNRFPSGVYVYRLQFGNYFSSKKMILLK